MIGKETDTLVCSYAAMQEHEVKLVANYTSEKQELITVYREGSISSVLVLCVLRGFRLFD